MRYIILLILSLPVLVFGAGLYVFYPDIYDDTKQTALHYPKAAVSYVTATSQEIAQDIVSAYQGVENGVKTSFNTTTNAVTNTVNKGVNGINNVVTATGNHVTNGLNIFQNGVSSFSHSVMTSLSSYGRAIGETVTVVASLPQQAWNATTNSALQVKSYTTAQWDAASQYVQTALWPEVNENEVAEMQTAEVEQPAPTKAEDLATLEPAAGRAGEDPPEEFDYIFPIEERELLAEAVLVPREKTVISSSRDGKIKSINFDNGDTFKKGDIILEYYCDASEAELEAAKAERRFAGEKLTITSRLYNMELASGLEKQLGRMEAQQAEAKAKVAEMRLNDCFIRADYDGRVVKKLANDNEYTRTDRVLMEVASKGTLDVEFLLPSRALRWVNVDAPITLNLAETGRQYTGSIKRIYGEVDPVSQSIQVRAGLDNYPEPLLPGMSGQITVDIEAIRAAGIAGFLESSM